MKQPDCFPPEWSEVELAYYAGLFDGEGYVGIRRDTRDEQQFLYGAHVTNTDPRPLVRLRALFGGGICRDKGVRGCIWKWTIYGQNLNRFLMAIAPHLIIKKDQVEVFLEARRLSCRGSQRHSSESRRVLTAALLRLKELKRVRYYELPEGRA